MSSNIDFNLLPLPNLPLPDLRIFIGDELSPITNNQKNKTKNIPSLVSLCSSSLIKHQQNLNNNNNIKYLPNNLKDLLRNDYEKKKIFKYEDDILPFINYSSNLNFSKYSFIKQQTIYSCIYNSKPQLTSLILDGIFFDKNFQLFQNFHSNLFPYLKYLSLNSSTIYNNQIEPIIKNSPKLSSISLENCKYLNISNILCLLSQNHMLYYLNISNNTYIDYKSIILLLNHCNIRIFKCNNSSNWLTSIILQDIIKHIKSNIIHLSLNKLYCLSDNDLLLISKYYIKLQILSIKHCWNITDTGIKYIINNCKSLNNIYIDSCSQITDKTIDIICNKNPNIKILSFKHCNLISNNGLTNLINTCKYIQEVNINGDMPNIDILPLHSNNYLRSISISGNQSLLHSPIVSQLSKNCKNINSLSFEDNMFLETKTIVSLVKSWKHLRSIKLNNCLQLDDPALYSISKYCYNLEEFSALNCFFTCKTISCFIKYTNSLHTINFNGSNQFNDNHLQELTKYCSIKYIDIRNCKHITTNGLNNYINENTSLEVLLSSLYDTNIIESILSHTKLYSITFESSKYIKSTFDNNTCLSFSNTSNLIRRLYFIDILLCDNIFINIINSCKNLEYIEFNNCLNITENILPTLYNTICDKIIITGENNIKP